MLHLRRYFTALAVLSALCGAYALAVAPLVEPPPLKVRPAGAAPPLVQVSDHTREDLRRLFRPDEWENDTAKVKVIETERATLLIQDYQPTPDGRLKLTPCTIIFYAGGETPSGAKTPRRPIVLQAPAGAILQFDRPLDLGRAEFGRLVKGTLSGPITISSPPTRPGGGDALRLTTRDVDLDRERIFTSHEVQFDYGQSSGLGRVLTILLQGAKDIDRPGSSSPLGAVQSLRLEHIDYLRIATEGRGLLGDALDSGGKSAGSQQPPLVVTCHGPFTFDVLSQLARFEQQVEVLRLIPGGQPERLRCDELLLAFALRKEDRAIGITLTAHSADDDPLAGLLQRVIAIGNPAVLEAPGSGVRAVAAWMEYQAASRRLALKCAEKGEPPDRASQVTLQQREQHFVARQLQYELAESGRLGRLWAEGPGELKMIQGRGPVRQTIVARWERELRVRPHERNQVISLEGAAGITMDPFGRFDANELHVWVLEVPDEHPANSPPADAPPAAQAPAAAPAAASPPQTTILPDRLLATGNVRLASPRLDAECARLEAWFINRPSASDDGPAAPPRGRFEPLREPVQPASFAQSGAPEGAIRNVIRPPNLQKFRVGGELIQLQLVVAGRQFDLEDLMIDKRATIDETRTPQEGQQPIHIAGDLIELHHGTSPEAKVEIIGRQAEAGGRGLTLAGRKIEVYRGRNELLIDGPGEATLPAPDGQSLAIIPRSDRGPGAAAAPPLHRPAPLPPQKLHLDWQEGLTFDGQTVHIRGDVHARTSTQLAMAKTLDAQLSQRVDFAGSISGQQPELARLHLGGGVFIENRGEDERGQQTSLDQGNFPNLTIDRAAGKLRVAGQGWVNTVRRAGELLPAQPQPGAPPRGPIQPPRGDDAPLTSIHIDFERGIEGDLARREIEFQQQVRTTYAPAREFTDQIVVRRLADLGPRGVLMTSQRLMIRELALPGRPPFLEADATGNVVIDHVQFTANGAHVRYSGDKETLVISGDGFADSLISYESEPGLPRSTSQARKYTYWIREGVFQGEGFKSINLLPGGLLRLPR